MKKIKITFLAGEMRGIQKCGNYMMNIGKIEIEDAEGYTDFIDELYAEVPYDGTDEEYTSWANDDYDFDRRSYQVLRAEILEQAKEYGISEDRLEFPSDDMFLEHE